MHSGWTFCSSTVLILGALLPKFTRAAPPPLDTCRAPEVVGMPTPDDIKRLGLAPHQVGHYGCKAS